MLFPKNGKGQLQGATQVGAKTETGVVVTSDMGDHGVEQQNMGTAQLIAEDKTFGEYLANAHIREAKVTGISLVRSISADVLSVLIQLH